jgi:hypothetical protein
LNSEAEIAENEPSIGGDENVIGLDVSVDYATLMQY